MCKKTQFTVGPSLAGRLAATGLALCVWGSAGAGNITTISVEEVRNELSVTNASGQGAMLIPFDRSAVVPKQLLVGAPTTTNGLSFVGRVVRQLSNPDGSFTAAATLVTPPGGDVTQGYFGISGDRFGDRHMIGQVNPAAGTVYQALAVQQTLTPTLTSPGTQEGVVSVATYGDFAAVGVPFDDGDRGRLHLWRFNGTNWVAGQILSSGANAEVGGRFAAAVDMSADMLLVGAPGENVRGRVYVYRLNAVTQQWESSGQLPVPSIYDSAVAAKFGFSLVIDRTRGNKALVGAPGAKWTNRSQVTGGVSSFDYDPDSASGWQAGSLYLPDDPQNAHQFGFDVDLRDGDALMTDIAYMQGGGLPSTLGAVFGFDLDVPLNAPVVRVYRYARPLPAPNNLFGYTARYFGENVLVGAPVNLNASGGATNRGVVYEFPGPAVFRDGFE